MRSFEVISASVTAPVENCQDCYGYSWIASQLTLLQGTVASMSTSMHARLQSSTLCNEPSICDRIGRSDNDSAECSEQRSEKELGEVHGDDVMRYG